MKILDKISEISGLFLKSSFTEKFGCKSLDQYSTRK